MSDSTASDSPRGGLFVSNHPAVQHKLALLRATTTEPKKFRELVRELSWLLGYEALADVHLRTVAVETPLERIEAATLADRIGLVPILRAGLGMVDAMLELMPTAEVWHLGLFRDERTLRPVEYYNKLPVRPTVDLCLILDPMLATGGSATAAIEVLKRWGATSDQARQPDRRTRGRGGGPGGPPGRPHSLRRPGSAAQRPRLHPARPRRRGRPPVRDGPVRLRAAVGRTSSMGKRMIFPKVRDPRFITVRRGGTLEDQDHRLLAVWAADCAEHVLHYFEEERPTDDRPRRAIDLGRAWARGEIPWAAARTAAGHANGAARDLRGAARYAAYAAGQAAAVGHVAAHELGAAAYAIRAVRAVATEDDRVEAGRLECQWQRTKLPREIRGLVLDDQRLRNELCWFAFDC